MASLKLMVWNTAWMNDLFDANGKFRTANSHPQHEPSSTIKQRRDQLSAVIDESDADVIVIIEGPNSTAELQRFFDLDVTGKWQAFLQNTAGSSQCIGCAVRTDRGALHPTQPLLAFDTTTRLEFQPFHIQDESDGLETAFSFERLPLYVEIRMADGAAFRILGLHLKSKGIFSAYEWSKWWAVADAARKKILAQTTQVRTAFLDPYLTDPATAGIPLVVCGDINDGPGLDASEKKLLGSGIERLMGNVWRPRLCLGNALYDALPEKDRRAQNFASLYTVAFRDPIFNNMTHEEWIDHILYTCPPGGKPFVQDGAVMRNAANSKDLLKTYKYASDHYPVVARIVL
jgi:hypothetical protein